MRRHMCEHKNSEVYNLHKRKSTRSNPLENEPAASASFNKTRLKIKISSQEAKPFLLRARTHEHILFAQMAKNKDVHSNF